MKTNITYNMDALTAAKLLPDDCVDCIVTSPPYYGLRDYGVIGQIGLEATPEQYIRKLVELFRELRRALKSCGTLWINIGDTYAAGSMTPHAGQRKNRDQSAMCGLRRSSVNGLKNKDLIGIPWMLAFALRADGWYLRSDIIWHKPNPMPESVTDRPTKAHEYIFLLSKSPKYYYDVDAIREPHTSIDDLKRRIQNGHGEWKTNKAASGSEYAIAGTRRNRAELYNPKGRNKRSVWSVPTAVVKEAHFATFPEALIVPCVLAGCPEGGIVLDPFMGSGTTAVVARKNNRQYIGFELNKDYVDITNDRLRRELGLFHCSADFRYDK